MDFDPFLQTLPDYHPTSETICHPTLGDFSVLQNYQGAKILRKHIPKHQLVGVDISSFDKYQKLSYCRIIQLKGIVEEKNHAMPGFTAYYEYFGETLKEEIERKASTNTQFEELEVLKILQNITSSLAFMQTSKIPHGEIKSINIVKVDGDYRVLNPVLFGKWTVKPQIPRPVITRAYTKIISQDIRHALHRDVLDSVHEDYKDDVYGAGLIALDLMTLQVDPSLPVEKRLERANFFYSNSLVRFVRKMLESVLSLRLDPVSCNAYIESIHMKHGLVSLKRFSKHGRNQSLSLRDANSEMGSEEISQDDVSPIKQEGRERRAGSVAPKYSRDSSFYTESTPTRANIFMSYNQHSSPRRYATLSDLSPSISTSNSNVKSTNRVEVSYERAPSYQSRVNADVYAKYDKPIYRPDHSIASTNATENQRVSKLSTFESMWSIGETPRISVCMSSGPANQEKYSSVESKSLDKENYQPERLAYRPSYYDIFKQETEEDKKKKNSDESTTKAVSPSFHYDYKVAYETNRQNFTNPEEPKKITHVLSEQSDSINVRVRVAPVMNEIAIERKPIPAEVFKSTHSTFKESNQENISPNNASADLQNIVLKETESLYQEESPLQKDQTPFRTSIGSSILNSQPQEIFTSVSNLRDQDQQSPSSVQEISVSIQKSTYDLPSIPLPSGALKLDDVPRRFRFVRKIGDLSQESRNSIQKRYSISTSLSQHLDQSMYSQGNIDNETSTPPLKTSQVIKEKQYDGAIYEGEMIGYLKQGRGKMTYPDGKIYEGEWRAGRINGQGALFGSNGEVIYEGEWVDDKYNGRGVQNNTNVIAYRGWEATTGSFKNKSEGGWLNYRGSFKEGVWEGFGEVSFENGDRYVGEFKNDSFHGWGKYTRKLGNYFEGRWDCGCFLG